MANNIHPDQVRDSGPGDPLVYFFIVFVRQFFFLGDAMLHGRTVFWLDMP